MGFFVRMDRRKESVAAAQTVIDFFKVVGTVVCNGLIVEVVGRRRCSGLPLHADACPTEITVAFDFLAKEQRVCEVDQRKEQSSTQHHRTHRRDLMHAGVDRQQLWGDLVVGKVTTRHPLATHHKLREEGKVEAEEDKDGRDSPAPLVVMAAKHFGPPVVDGSEEADERSTDHDVMEVRDNKIGVVKVNVCGERGKEKTGQSADGEQENERECVEHRCVEDDGTFVERRHPAKDFDGGGYGNSESDHREKQRSKGRLTTDKHVVTPYKEADNRDGNAGCCDESVTKDVFARMNRDGFADHAKGREDHDVHSGVRVEPEKVLVQDGIAAHCRIKDPDTKGSFKDQKQQGDGQHGSCEDLDERSGVKCPQEQGHPRPSHPRRTHLVDGNNKVDARQDGGKAKDESAEGRGDHSGIGGGTVGRVERPACIQTTGNKGVKEEHCAENIDIKAKEVEAREGNIFCAEHQGQEEVSKGRRDRRDQEQEDHDRAVQGEQLVVKVGSSEFKFCRIFSRDKVGQKVSAGGKEFETNPKRKNTTRKEKDQNRSKIHQTDTLVIERKKPRHDRVVDIEVIFLFCMTRGGWASTRTNRICCSRHAFTFLRYQAKVRKGLLLLCFVFSIDGLNVRNESTQLQVVQLALERRHRRGEAFGDLAVGIQNGFDDVVVVHLSRRTVCKFDFGTITAFE